MDNPLRQLEKFGQSPWYDSISREMIDSGTLKRLIEVDGLKGVTSNPTIFEKAIAGGADYDAKIASAVRSGLTDPKSVFESLAVDDIRDAADALAPVFERSGGGDGFVSLEVSPTLAYDTEETVREAKRLHAAVGRKNLMIKVPATRQGLPAITRLIADGICVNVTLIFSIARHREVMEAYLAGLEKQRNPSAVASVASFFVSRIDTSVDKLLEGKGRKDLAGKAAVANAKLAYAAFREIFSGPRFQTLKKKGARVQRPLWASTSTKNPAYRDVIYVEELIGADTVNTIPPATWDAFREHGKLRAGLTEDLDEARDAFARLKSAGVDLDRVTDELEAAGVKSFADSFKTLLDCIAQKSPALQKTP